MTQAPTRALTQRNLLLLQQQRSPLLLLTQMDLLPLLLSIQICALLDILALSTAAMERAITALIRLPNRLHIPKVFATS